nr:MAG TPA: hypothetical protein [Caudoviricetes sp.]
MMTEVDMDIWNELPDNYEPTIVIYTANQWN